MDIGDIATKIQQFREQYDDMINTYSTKYSDKLKNALIRKDKLTSDVQSKYAGNEAKLQEKLANIQEEYTNTLTKSQEWLDDKKKVAQDWVNDQINKLTDNFKASMEKEAKENEEVKAKDNAEKKKSDNKIDALIK